MLRGRPGGVAEAYLGALALKQDTRLRLLLGIAHVLRQTRQSPIVCLRQVPVQDISNLLHPSTTGFTRMSLGPGTILMPERETHAAIDSRAYHEQPHTIAAKAQHNTSLHT